MFISNDVFFLIFNSLFSAANISLSQRTYEVSESDERFTVVVERFDSLSKKTRLKLEMFSGQWIKINE